MKYEYEYEIIPKKKKNKNPDDMLKTIPELDPTRYKRGVVAFVCGIVSFLVAFVFIVWAWIGSLVLACVGIVFAVLQQKIKRTKISNVALIICIFGVCVFSCLIVLFFTTDIFLRVSA